MAMVKVFLICLLGVLSKANKAEYVFPEDFIFGVATSAYQIEGAWDANGKGPSFWDNLTHNTSLVVNGETGDVACDSYNKYKEDIRIMKNLGVNFYRFSLAWSRILPNGKIDTINEDGIRYYNNLIDEILLNGIIPMVTIYHWDIPLALHEEGGFNNDKFADYFGDFADLAYKSFGDRVQYWFTFNEPNNCCWYVNMDDPEQVTFYECSKNLLKAHGRAYKIYDEKYRPTQNGKVSMVIDNYWYEPADEEEINVAAAKRYTEFMFGIWAHPIYHGDYPEDMKTYIGELSEKQGLEKSRLPEFTQEEIDEIKGSHDIFAFNHYSSKMVAHQDPIVADWSNRENDASIVAWQPDDWPGPTNHSTWLKVVPWGFRKCLKYIKDNYNDPEIYISENGFSDVGEIFDLGRIEYFESYMKAMLDAMNEDEVTVKAYTAWSLMDNFEWLDGYQSKFGLHTVNFNNPDRPRTPKASAVYYKEVISSHSIPDSKSFKDTYVSP